ncbi:MAG: ribonuclease P protein component [Clostridia bacterium]|nr:ribonuclease P protein component [Clostridia bacterium]
MLKRVNRLKKRYQFNYVYKAGAHFSDKALVLYVTPAKTKSIKVGFSVTKKIGKAVVRNFTKRRLREIVAKQLPNLKQNYNIIVVAKDNISSFSFADLEKQFAKLLSQAELFNEKSV